MWKRIKQVGRSIPQGLWAAVIFLLPITSFPLFSRWAGGVSVAPLSLLPLLLLGMIWSIPFLYKRRKFPSEAVPLLAFCASVLVSCALAFFKEIPPYKGTFVFMEEYQSIASLVIGVAFYLVTLTWLSSSHSRLIQTFKWINISGAVVLIWAGIQAFYIFFDQSDYPALLLRFQRLISTRDLFIGRITSFAFEPSWLAHQLNLLYLPIWLGASLAGFSAFRFRVGKLRVETILFVGGAVAVFLASRVGTLALLGIFAYLGLLATRRIVLFFQTRASRKTKQASAKDRFVVKWGIPVLVVGGFAGGFLIAAIGLVYALSRVDTRLAVLFDPASIAILKTLYKDPYLLFNFLKFAERYVYWVSGWKVFNAHPFFGVGMGNAGFFFKEWLPSYSWSLPEVLDIYYRADFIPNIKSLWVRILAETGIVGFSTFISWLYTTFVTSRSLRRETTPVYSMAGWIGLFALIALVVEGFSIDSFALPYLWITFALVHSARAVREQG